MRRVAKLIHRRNAFQPEAAVDENAGVPCEGHGIAGDRDGTRHLAGGDLP